MSDGTLILLLALVIAAGMSAGAYLVLSPYLSGAHRATRRIQVVTEARGKRLALKVQTEAASSRKKAVADTLKDIEERNKVKARPSLRARLQQAGLDVSENAYYVASGVCGLVCVLLIMLFATDNMVAVLLGGFVGVFGLPRWILGKLIQRRQNKFISEFANAVDVIVRGIKSGLPLNECLGIIARESPEPIAGEFREVVEQQRVGVPLAEALDRLMLRVPLPEVRFFAIVVSISQQSGGNLSEALSNLSTVLRDRKKLQGKVSAMSAEAKASAAVLGALPFLVTLIVYISTPTYIAYLWNTQVGLTMLVFAGGWMALGVFVMKKMIAFKY